MLRLVQNKEGMHKLSPPWEGPFVISKNLNNGSYYLMDVREPASVGKGADTAHTLDPYAEAKRPWNIAQFVLIIVEICNSFSIQRQRAQ